MKCAVPMSGGLVATHFGHCEQFALIDVDEAKKQILNKELVPQDMSPVFSPNGWQSKESRW